MLLENGFMGQSLSNGEDQGSLMKTNVEDVLSASGGTRPRQPAASGVLEGLFSPTFSRLVADSRTNQNNMVFDLPFPAAFEGE